MHSSEAQPAGPGLLLALGRLILRARTPSPAPPTGSIAPPRHKQRPSTSQQVLVQSQPTQDDEDTTLEHNFRNHVNALWTDHVPICVEVLLGPSCSECYATMSSEEPAFPLRGLLLERWTMQLVLDKRESPAAISSPWLLNAVRSQLHFSQLAAWRARAAPAHLAPHKHHALAERRRKLSREQCTLKKPPNGDGDRNLNVIYTIKNLGCNTPFVKPPTDHTFPLTDIGDAKYLKVVLESLPRLDEIPEVTCACQKVGPEELVGRLNDLNIGSRKFDGAINSNIGTSARRLCIISNPGSTEYLFTIDKVVDDRMHTPCSENGKHKCNCDDESDGKEKNQAKKLDERRAKEIAKYKRRIRKEKDRKFCDSTSSEGEVKKETTSIPILQASRFDRFRAIGCYRNQTYLTLPASRIETKSPFIHTNSITPTEFKTKTVGTQTDSACPCGGPLEVKCEICSGMVRSEGIYNLASLQENGVRRKLDIEDDDKSLKKHKCDNISNVSGFIDGFIKRPKLRRFFPIVDKLEKIVIDRNQNTERDMRDLHLRNDDSVFSTAKEAKVTLKTDQILMLPQKTDGQFSMEKESSSSQNFDETICLQYNTDNQFSMDEQCKELQSNESQFAMENGYKQSIDGQLSMDKEHNGLPQRTEEFKNLPQRTDEFKNLPQRTDDEFSPRKESKRQKTFSISEDEFVLYEKCDYGTIDRHETESPKDESTDFKFSIPDENGESGDNKQVDKLVSLKDEFIFPDPKWGEQTPGEMDRFRWRFDSAASMVFHSKTGLPLTSSPAPLRRGKNCFDFDDSINDINGIKSALFHPISPEPPAAPASPPPAPRTPPPRRGGRHKGTKSGLLGSFEECALQGRLEAVATVQGFTAELGASGAFCPPHRRLPVTVSFYAPGGTAAPYMGHISLGPGGYRVARAGSVQVSLFNPHGTLVKMFVVLYDLSRMPPAARTFLRQRTLHHAPHAPRLRYLIHLRFMTSKSGKLYLHTDIRLLVSRKADLDTATAHCSPRPPRAARSPTRVFGGSAEHDAERGYDSSSVCDLRSVTFAPDNPKYSPR